MKFANIAPNKLFDIIDKNNDMHLLLVHWAMKNEEYASLYRDSKVYKILDNSYYELKTIMPTNELLRYACYLNAQEVVAPDEMYDIYTTVNLVKKFIEDVKKLGVINDFKIQAVVCGKTKLELKKCFKWMLYNNDIDVIAFSRRGNCFSNLCHDVCRYEIVKWADEFMKKSKIVKPLHLLGANGIKDYYRKWPESVRSIDSKQFTNAVLGKWKIIDEVSNKQKEIFEYIIKNAKKNIERNLRS